MAKEKPVAFMVFSEMLDLPDGTNRAELLNNPNTPGQVKDAIRRDINQSKETVAAIAQRDTQRERHAENHERRDRVLAGLVRDQRGKPKYGEAKRLAKLHGVDVRQVQKWIQQVRKSSARPATALFDDWSTVIEGEMIREQNRAAARRPKKSKR
jgi:transposase-like protein